MDSNLLPFFYLEGTADVAVSTGEGFVVNLDLQRLFGSLLRRGESEVAQAFFPRVEFVLVATAEEESRTNAEDRD